MAVPKLRFKDFSNNWDEITTGEIFDNIVDNGYTDKTVLTIVQGIGTVPRAESGRNMIYNENAVSGYKRVKKNDFIIHLRSFEGGLEKANGDGVGSPAYTILRPKNKIATSFLYDYFHTNKFINSVLAKAVEGIRDGRQISYNMFKWLKIPFTSYEEQKKISAFLTTFDKRITAQKNIVADLEETKKGLLQKIFSQEIRFKDDNGQDYPKWETHRLSDYAEYVSSTACCEAPCYLGTEDMISNFGGVNIKKSQGNYSGYRFGKNNIILGNIRPYLKKCWISDRQGICSTDLLVMNVKGIYPEILFMKMCTDEFVIYNMKGAKGTKMPRGDKKHIMNWTFRLPENGAEQQNIADFLSTFDKKITAEKQVLSDLQEMKKGLLQQMFV